MLQNSENNGTEEIGFVTPSPAWYKNVNVSPGYLTYVDDACKVGRAEKVSRL